MRQTSAAGRGQDDGGARSLMGRGHAFHRSLVAALVALALAACAGTTPGRGPAAPAPPAAQSEDALAVLNEAFRAAYGEARRATVRATDPVIVAQFDDLHLIRQGQIRTERFTPPIYHEYKAIAHVALALHVMLAPVTDRPLGRAVLDRLAGYRRLVVTAGRTLDGRPGWTAEQVTAHRAIVDASLALIDTAVGAGEIADARLVAYARAMRPILLGSATAAARAQLDGLHTLVTRWREALGAAAWARVHVVVLGGKQARAGNVQYAYFRQALGPDAEGRRLWYAEGIFDTGGGLDLLGTILLDRAAAVAFFADPARLERDLLADAAAEHLGRLFPPR